MTADKVSVVVPVHNGEAYIREALESLLAQSRPELEIIVVDDGSSDASASLVRDCAPGAIVISQLRRGVAAARNRGIAAASGAMIGFLDADDLWTERALELQLGCLAANPAADLVWGRTEPLVMGDATRQPLDWVGVPQWALSVGSMLFRRAILERAGGFDEALAAGEDMDLMIRVRELGARIVRNDAIVYRARFHGGSHFSQDGPLMSDAHFRAVAKALARKRREPAER